MGRGHMNDPAVALAAVGFHSEQAQIARWRHAVIGQQAHFVGGVFAFGHGIAVQADGGILVADDVGNAVWRLAAGNR